MLTESKSASLRDSYSQVSYAPKTSDVTPTLSVEPGRLPTMFCSFANELARPLSTICKEMREWISGMISIHMTTFRV